MSDAVPSLRTALLFVHVTHGVVALRFLVGMVGLAVSATSGPDALYWVHVGISALSLGATGFAGLAAVRAAQAGFGAPARRVLGGLVVLAVLVATSRVMSAGDPALFQAPVVVMTDLVVLAWCALLGRMVEAVDVADARLLRMMAMGWLLLHAGIQLVPLAGLAAIGPLVLGMITLGSTVVPFGAAVVDAIRLQRASPVLPALLPAQGAADPDLPDDPWRPGA